MKDATVELVEVPLRLGEMLPGGGEASGVLADTVAGFKEGPPEDRLRCERSTACG